MSESSTPQGLAGSSCRQVISLACRGLLAGGALLASLCLAGAWLTELPQHPAVAEQTTSYASVRALQLADNSTTVWVMRHPSRLQSVDLATGRVLTEARYGVTLTRAMQVNAAGTLVALGNERGDPRVLQPGYEDAPARVLTASSNPAWQYALSPRHPRMVQVNGPSLELWSLKDEPTLQADAVLDEQVSSLVWSPDGSCLLVLTTNGRLTLHDGESLAVVQSVSTPLLGCTTCTWSASSRFVLAYDPKGRTIVWDIERQGSGLRSIDLGPSYCSRAALSPDGRWLAHCRGGLQLGLLDLERPDQPALLAELSTTVSAVCFTTDGTRLLIGTLAGELICWSFPDGRLLWQTSGM
jgi:WD40 repeat protein